MFRSVGTSLKKIVILPTGMSRPDFATVSVAGLAFRPTWFEPTKKNKFYAEIHEDVSEQKFMTQVQTLIRVFLLLPRTWRFENLNLLGLAPILLKPRESHIQTSP
jgi:hypothetical protein